MILGLIAWREEEERQRKGEENKDVEESQRVKGEERRRKRGRILSKSGKSASNLGNVFMTYNSRRVRASDLAH